MNFVELLRAFQLPLIEQIYMYILKDLLLFGAIVGFMSLVFAASALFTKKAPKETSKDNTENDK